MTLLKNDLYIVHSTSYDFDEYTKFGLNIRRPTKEENEKYFI